jgi:signal transduction histidine kinase
MTRLSDRLASTLVLGAVVIGFLLILGIGLIGVSVMQRNLAFTDLVAHTHEVQDAIADYRILNERMETARRGYLLSPEAAFARVFEETSSQLPGALQRIGDLTRDNPDQQARVARAQPIMRNQIAMARVAVANRQASSANFADDVVVRDTRAIRLITQEMTQDEAGRLAHRNNERRRSIRQLVGVIIAAGVLTAIVAVGSLWVIWRYTRDLTASHAALAQLNESLEEEVNSRTAELSRANEEIQRFAYIVSHDLRSPLVNVMGFTGELEAAAKPLVALIQKADAEAPGLVSADARTAVMMDLPESLGFIRASTQKMDRLINAILRLSREGRRVLTPERIELGKLFDAVVATVRHRADELGAEVVIADGLPGLVSDRLALEQIFANLIENALKYLKPGRPGLIEVRAHRRGERVIVEIADNGRGIDPRDHARIFDLFRRSGMQDQPGEGIGLAHVRALGYRLGATVTVDSTLDGGATFRISLPATLSPETAAA